MSTWMKKAKIYVEGASNPDIEKIFLGKYFISVRGWVDISHKEEYSQGTSIKMYGSVKQKHGKKQDWRGILELD